MGVFTMPSLGADMEAGTLVEWMIKPGDTVKRGDAVAVVETQKGAIEIECFEEGTVETLDAELGARLPVGAALATIRVPGEKSPELAAVSAQPRMSAKSPQKTSPVLPVTSTPEPTPATPRAGDPPPSSPAARFLAAERGIDIALLSGSGPGGAVLLADVEAAPPTPLQSPSAKPAAKPGLDLDAMRTAIANAMARSKREIPHFYLTQTIDLQATTDWLAATNARRPPEARVLMGAVFVKVSALAAAQVPEMNGHYDSEGFHPVKAVHAGVAVSLRGGGLVAPALHDVDTLSLDEVMARMRDLVARARTARLRSSEMTDGTITISALGDAGADAMAAVIYPPQVAIVGFGAPVRRPWIVVDTIVPRTTVTVTLSADHRVSDGRRGAKFLAAIEAALQKPEVL